MPNIIDATRIHRNTQHYKRFAFITTPPRDGWGSDEPMPAEGTRAAGPVSHQSDDLPDTGPHSALYRIVARPSYLTR